SDALLSVRAMGEFVIRLLDMFELENPHAVGPDIGTGSLLFAAATHPGRLRSLVVGGGASAFPLAGGSPLKEGIEAPELCLFRSVDSQHVCSSAVTPIEQYPLPDVVREDYLSSYEGDRFVESMRF